MNDEVRAALLEARRHADPKTRYVISWNGKPLKRVKGAFERAAKRAGLEISPYILRHTAAVWMAEAGVPLEEIAQYMGHTNIEITRKHYARYSPTHLRRAANATQVHGSECVVQNSAWSDNSCQETAEKGPPMRTTNYALLLATGTSE